MKKKKLKSVKEIATCQNCCAQPVEEKYINNNYSEQACSEIIIERRNEHRQIRVRRAPGVKDNSQNNVVTTPCSSQLVNVKKNKAYQLGNLSHGFYIVDSACGAGKTTEIYHFIIQHYNEGVLYCVDTIEELHKMYDSLRRRLVDTKIIQEDDIVMITSEEDVNLKMMRQSYQADPTILCEKKILLLTHVRFFSNLINFFLVYRPKSVETYFDADFRTLLSRSDLRQWIFFDETPMWIQPFSTLPRSSLGIFTDNNNNCKSLGGIIESYRKFLKGTPQDPFKHSTRLDLLKKETTLSIVPTMYLRWISEDKSKDIQIKFKPIDLNQPNIRTRVLVFEGVGDLLLRSNQYPLIGNSSTPKYNANISFCPIPISTKRNDGYDEKEYMQSLDTVIKIILDHYNRKERTLITIWQSSEKITTQAPNTSLFRDKIKDYIRGRIQDVITDPNIEHYFDVIYYGENKCKSCNDYRDFSSIILFGKWTIPNDKVLEHNCNWGTDVSSKEFNMWFFVQLICRIGIRNHKGGEFRVYYTNDFSPAFINALEEYFKGTYIPQKNEGQDICKRLLEVGIKREIREYVTLLAMGNPELKTHILNSSLSPYYLSLKKEELRKILPTDNGNFSRSKKRLEKALSKLSVRIVLN